MTQPGQVWIKALHPEVSDGVDIFPPRGILEFPSAIITDDPLEGKIVIQIASGGAVGGDLSGTTTVAVVEKVKGTAIGTAGGALAVGKVLRVTGSATADWGALDLADADAVTGVLPAGNQASQVVAGDVTGTTAATVVENITGAGGFVDIASTGGTLRFNEDASVNILQTTQDADAATNDMTLSPQAPFATATLGNREPGSLVIQLSDPTNGGTTNPVFQVKQASTEIAAAFKTSSTHFAISINGTEAVVKDVGSYLSFGNTSYAAVAFYAGNELFINSVNYTIIRGGTTGIYLDCGGGALRMRDGGFAETIAWALNSAGATSITAAETVTSTTFTQATRTTDAVTRDLTLSPQAPWASATGTNRDPGDVHLNIPAPVGGSNTKNGGVNASRNGTSLVRIGMYSGGSTYGAIWFVDAGSPGGTNYGFLGNQSQTTLNSPIGGTTYITAGNNAGLVLTSTKFEFFKDFAVPQYRIDLNDTAVFAFTARCTSATIKQDQQTSGAGAALLVAAQDAQASGNVAGGILSFRGGANNGSGLKGGFRGQMNGTTETGVEWIEVITGQRVLALAVCANLTSTEMPANTGDGVIFVGNAQTTPTTGVPANGFEMWGDSGAGKGRGAGGTTTTFIPSDLDGFKDTAGEGHCPQCGRDFAHEWHNPSMGSLTVCMWCLTEELGDRPYIIRKAQS